MRLVLVAGAVSLGALVAPSGLAAAPARVESRPEVAAEQIAEYAGGALWLAQVERQNIPRSRIESASFVAWRARVAADVARVLELDPVHLEAVWSRADADHQIALMAALSQLGTPYKRRASQPGVAFDCSGLTGWAWAEAGHVLPRNSTLQWRAGEARTPETAQAGDLVRYPGHVMMWLGVDGAIVHSPRPGGVVEVRHLSDRSLRKSKFFDPS